MEKIVPIRINAISSFFYVKAQDVKRPPNTVVWGMTREGVHYKIEVVENASWRKMSGNIEIWATVNCSFPDIPLKFIDPQTIKKMT